MAWVLTSNLTTLEIIKRQVKLGEKVAMPNVPLVVVVPLQSFPLTSTPVNACLPEGLSTAPCTH